MKKETSNLIDGVISIAITAVIILAAIYIYNWHDLKSWEVEYCYEINHPKVDTIKSHYGNYICIYGGTHDRSDTILVTGKFTHKGKVIESLPFRCDLRRYKDAKESAFCFLSNRKKFLRGQDDAIEELLKDGECK